LLHQPNNFHQAFQREILALYRRQQFVSGGKSIAHQNSKRRRTIQKNKTECLIGVQRLQRFRQTREVIRHTRDFDLGAGQIEIGGHDKQAVAPRRKDFFSNGSFAKQGLVKTDVLHSLQTKRAGCVRLWIKIDKQNAMAQFRQSSAEIHGRGRFADAAFLICYRDDFHSVLRIRSGVRDLPDDVAAHGKRKLNFSNFGFGCSV